MNEIKFRALNKINGRMMQLTDYSWMRQASNPAVMPITATISAFYISGEDRGQHVNFYSRDDIILLPFIGKKDKNDVEIYEGDKLVASYDQYRFDRIVKYSDEDCCFYLEDVRNGKSLSLKISDYELEVVGTIFIELLIN